MHDLTGYFITTDRVHAAEALASLRSQGIPREIAVVRNVRPLRAAHLPTLECQTPYCVILDDDTVLNPGVLPMLLDAFRERRRAEPSAYKLNAVVYSEAQEQVGQGGVKLLYAPHLLRIGWPDEPHVSFAQKRAARQLGLTSVKCDVAAGIQKRGTDLDVYKKYLWLAIRGRAGQGHGVAVPSLIERARTGPAWLWFAALGALDGETVGAVATSKDELFLGPIGKTLDFDSMKPTDIPPLLARRLAARDPHAG